MKLERNNIISFADVSPLPFLNIDTTEEAIKVCKNINTNILFEELDKHLESSNDQFIKDKFLDFDFSPYTALPSLKHGLSCLFSDHYRQKLNLKIVGEVSVQGFLTFGSTILEAIELEKKGFKKAKLKIGTTPITDESLKRENQLLKDITLKTQLTLRLDGNQKLKLNEIAAILRNIDPHRIDYAEDPLKEPKELENFKSITNINLALDENLKMLSQLKGKVSAVVLKPTVLGDFFTLKKITNECDKYDIKPIISSSFESQLGIYQLAELASAINLSESHGLDTHSAFLESLLDLEFIENKIQLKGPIAPNGPIFI